MEKTKKTYVKPDMNEMDIKLEPILSGSYPTNGDGYGGWFD